jgi:hypothetical protein
MIACLTRFAAVGRSNTKDELFSGLANSISPQVETCAETSCIYYYQPARL